MKTAKELLSILVRNQDRRYWRAIKAGKTPEEFYAATLETVASRMINEATEAVKAGRVFV